MYYQKGSVSMRIKQIVLVLLVFSLTLGIVPTYAEHTLQNDEVFETTYTRDFQFGLKDIKPAVGNSVYERYLNKRAELPNEIPIFQPYEPVGKREFYVSNDGRDSNPGTIDKPFKTVRHAVNYVGNIGDKSGVIIYIRGGVYDMSDGLNIPESASGADGEPLIISNYKDEAVHFVGGVSIDGSKLEVANDELAKKKLSESAYGKVYSVDLWALGINNVITPTVSGPPKMIVDGVEYNLARYPNATTIPMKKYEGADGENGVFRTGPITNSGSELGTVTGDTGEGFEFAISDPKPFTWENTGDIWMYGSWYAEWLKEYVHVKNFDKDKMSVSTYQHTPYGAKYHQNNYHYYLNVMEELDTPGEWYVDNNAGKLYVYPISDSIKSENIIITTESTDIVTFDNCENVVLNGITVECGGNNGITVSGRKNIVQNCTIQDVVKFGVYLKAKNCGVISSTIRRTGDFAVDIHQINESSGITDMSYLTPTRNFVQNCYIYNVLRGVYVNGGVQNIISHNTVMNTRAMGINIGWGNETIVEFNEVAGGPNVNYDSAQLYVNGNGMGRGSHVRYNYFHDALVDQSVYTATHCMYFDDRSSGHYAYGNILTGGGLFSHGGSENVFENNVIVDVQKKQVPLSNSDNYYLRSEDRWAGWVVSASSIWHGVTKYSSVYNSAWWSRYPEFYDWIVKLEKHKLNYDSENHVRDELEDYLRMPRFTVIKDNIMVNTDDYNIKKPVAEYEVEYDGNIMYDKDPGFVDYKGKNYDLTDDSKVFKDNPNFKKLPEQSKMGVIIDDALFTAKPSMNDMTAVSPTNDANSFVLNTGIVLKWTQSYCSNYYDVQVATDENFSSVVFEKRVAHPECELPELEFGRTYYWRVHAGTKTQSVDNTPKSMPTAAFSTYTVDGAYKYMTPDTYSFEKLIEEIRNYAQGIIEEGDESAADAGALYKTGTRDKLAEKIKDAEKTVGSERIQSRLNAKQLRFKNEVLAVISENSLPYSRDIIEFDEGDWLNSNPVRSTVEFSEDKSSLTVSSTANFIMYYNKELTPKESVNFSVRYDKLNAWTSLGLKQIGAAASSPTQVNGYFVVIKSDYIELQKTPKPTGASDGIIASVENNGIVKEGQWHNITTSAEAVEDGVRCVFKVDGKTIFDYTDKDNPLYDIGCFAFMHNTANGSMSISRPNAE